MKWQIIHKLGQKNTEGTEVINKSGCLVGENQETWLQSAWILEKHFDLVHVSPNMQWLRYTKGKLTSIFLCNSEKPGLEVCN